MAILIPKMSPPSADALSGLESWLGRELPAAYVDFVGKHDGAQPEENLLATRDNEVGVSRFIPVNEAPRLAEEIDGFPAGVIAFAEDDCGNYFYVEPNSGSVRFWDHEVGDEGEAVAGDIAGFLEKIEPFDSASVKLSPSQVKHAWIDPDFLAMLKKDGAV